MSQENIPTRTRRLRHEESIKLEFMEKHMTILSRMNFIGKNTD
jgi:hypothetical protein